MDDEERWISEQAVAVRRVLADPVVRAELLGLLGHDDAERRRARRLEAARAELQARGLLEPPDW